MRIFVTGATGFIGSAIVQELLGAGHHVTGLARSDASAAALEATGAQIQRGDMNDLDGLARAAAASDGVIHTAFNHDFSTYLQNCKDDGQVIAALGSGLQGSHKPLLVTSGTAVLAPGQQAVETDQPDAANPPPRAISESAALAWVPQGVRAMVMRLPPSVHGLGDHGFVPMLIKLARDKGTSAYIGDGQNRWPAVHRIDAAKAFRLALETGTAGHCYHAIGDQGVPFLQMAQLIGAHLQVPVVALPEAQAGAHFGWMAHFAQSDLPASAALTQQWLGWTPTQAGLLEDLDQAAYFAH